MIPWEHLGDAAIPGTDGTLSLYRRDGEYSLRLDRVELMNSRMHDSEEVLARAAIEAYGGSEPPRVLIGGLGMGFTLRAALDLLPARASVVVAELVPEVADWNHRYLGALAGEPLKDPRVTLRIEDVAVLLKCSPASFDLVLLDTDNGPEGTSAEANERLYQSDGIREATVSLKPGGILAVWSAFPSRSFTDRLGRAGLEVRQLNSRARKGKGGRHIIWLARKPVRS